ncbi:unnamed protein product [Moneuplotes crassus]|uniref:NADP-dependent oxidoreductase domain-containing protein n=1 Tax=Euplotes crassus TaxID=5936 RepID=A0AAD2CW68_EUPCR|nr:unnamed protein product [Moneuplotes crassus]
MESSPATKMIYRYLGNSGIKVSLLSMGTMLVDYSTENEKTWLECAKYAKEAGVNYFDSAEMYGYGKGDELLGRAIKENEWRREDLVIAVKVFFGNNVNAIGLSRKKIIEATKSSLKRMDLEYCDIVYAHTFDPETPLEETCRAFNWLIKKGYALYWGTSSWPEDIIMKAIKLCDEKGWDRPIVEQYKVEKGYERLSEEYGYGFAARSSLASGILSGKYNNDTIPKDSRFGKNESLKEIAWLKYFPEETKDETLEALKKFSDLAEENKATPSQLALAWITSNKDIHTCIFGASSLDQCKENLDSLETTVNWNEDLEKKVNEIFKNQPIPGFDAKKWSLMPPRRDQRLNLELKLGEIQYKSDYV